MIDFLRAILTCQVLWSIFLDRNCSGANKKKKKLFPEEIYLLINAPYFSRYSLRSYSRLAAHPVRELCSSGFVAPDSVRNKVNLVPHRWKSKLYSRPTAGEPLVSPGLKRHTPVRNKRILWYLTCPSSLALPDLAEVAESSLRLGSECRNPTRSALIALNIQVFSLLISEIQIWYLNRDLAINLRLYLQNSQIKAS